MSTSLEVENDAMMNITKRIFCKTVAFLLTLAICLGSLATNVKEGKANTLPNGCHVVLDFFWINGQTIMNSVGIARTTFSSTLSNYEAYANQIVSTMNQKSSSSQGNSIVFCKGRFAPLGIEFLKTMKGMNINVKFWEQVKKAAASGSVSKSMRIKASNKAFALCQRSFLLISNVIDSLAAEQSSIEWSTGTNGPLPFTRSTLRTNGQSAGPPTAQRILGTTGANAKPRENPVRIFFSYCLGSKGPYSTRFKALGQATSFWDLATKVGDQFIDTFVGRLVSQAYDTVDRRKEGPPFARGRRQGIYVKSLNYPDTTIHELGHYLGLSHLGDGDGFFTKYNIICPDPDKDESWVEDTPPGPGTLERTIEGKWAPDYLSLQKADWPRSCQSGKKMSMDNIMNSGDDDGNFHLMRFTEGQLRIMKAVAGELVR